MTNEEKELLIKDLCSRLPYGIIIYRITDNSIHRFQYSDIAENIDQFSHFLEYSGIDNIKPYLRPISSMTEEEKKEFTKVLVKSQDCSYENNESSTTIVNDWYLSKGFDVRGLIPKGLSLEAKEDMYK